MPVHRVEYSAPKKATWKWLCCVQRRAGLRGHLNGFFLAVWNAMSLATKEAICGHAVWSEIDCKSMVAIINLFTVAYLLLDFMSGKNT